VAKTTEHARIIETTRQINELTANADTVQAIDWTKILNLIMQLLPILLPLILDLFKRETTTPPIKTEHIPTTTPKP
jgi:hypothetical protein